MPVSQPPKSSTDSGFFTPVHPVEYKVLRKLRSEPRLKISSLVIRRIPAGVCLQGVIESDPDQVDLQQLLKQIDGVDQVINQLVHCRKVEG